MGNPEQSFEAWSSERWELYIASLPPILRLQNVQAVPDWLRFNPGAFPKRFDTHFFFASMPDEQAAEHDQLETTDSTWINPEDALTRHQEGRFPMVYATIRQLATLCDLGSIAAVRQRFTAQPVPTIQPKVVEYGGQPVIVTIDSAASADDKESRDA